MDRNFKKYLSAYGVGWKALTVIMSALTVAFLVAMLAGNDVKFVGLVVFAFGLIISLIPLLVSLRFFKDVKSDPAAEQIFADFKNAVSKRKDEVRFGDEWVFIKHKSKLLPYSEIKQVYQYIYKTSGIEKERALKYIDSKGRHHKLCKLALMNASEQEMVEIVCILLSKNPAIKISSK